MFMIYCLFAVKTEDVVPSTDLPPLVQGELQCFLHVVVQPINWSFNKQLSPSIIRLCWWGEESSNGTLFRYLRIISFRIRVCTYKKVYRILCSKKLTIIYC